jgi:transposase-like protein
MNIINIFKQFPDQESCIKYLEQKRWNNKPVCPYCQSDNTNPLKSENRFRHHCNGCRKSFSVTIGTIFEDSRLPLQKWFLAISLMLNAKKGISSRQLARDLELPVKTAWSVNHRIRKAMKQDNGLLSGIVEMDETYVGGKPRKEAKKKDEDDDDKGNPRGRGTKKECVVGMIERNGRVRASNVNKDSLKAKDLKDLVRANVDLDNTILMTDEYRGYLTMKRIINHLSINHSKEYARGIIHTNTIESFWAILKRGIMGQFHKVSKKYLNAYVDEFCWRFNERENKGSFDKLVGNMLFA